MIGRDMSVSLQRKQLISPMIYINFVFFFSEKVEGYTVCDDSEMKIAKHCFSPVLSAQVKKGGKKQYKRQNNKMWCNLFLFHHRKQTLSLYEG